MNEFLKTEWTIPLLSILCLILAAGIYFITLYGKYRENRRLTITDKIAAGFFAFGLIGGIALQLVTVKQQSIENQWLKTRKQHIYQLILYFHYNQPMPLRQFANLISKFQFVFGTYAVLEGEEPTRRSLEFTILPTEPNQTDLDRAIVFVCRNLDGNIMAQEPWYMNILWYRTNESGCIASSHKVWDSWDLEACGINAFFRYNKLGLGDTITTVDDLTKLSSFLVSLPNSLKLSDIDEFYLLFITSDHQCLWLDLTSLKFKTRNGSNILYAHMDGVGLAEQLKHGFKKAGGRRPPFLIVG